MMMLNCLDSHTSGPVSDFQVIVPPIVNHNLQLLEGEQTCAMLCHQLTTLSATQKLCALRNDIILHGNDNIVM